MFFFVFCSFFVNDFSTTRGRIHVKLSSHAGVLWFRMCLLPFWGLAAPGGRKKGEMKFSLLWESTGNFCISAVFERYLSNACTDPQQIGPIICVWTMSADVPPPPVGSIGPWVAEEGELKTPKIGGGSHSCIGQLPFVFLSDAKCGPICRAQTCAHSGVEPSRSAKAFLRGGPKSISSVGKKLYLSPIQVSHVFGPSLGSKG